MNKGFGELASSLAAATGACLTGFDLVCSWLRPVKVTVAELSDTSASGFGLCQVQALWLRLTKLAWCLLRGREGGASGPSSGSASFPLGQINLRSSPTWSRLHAAKCHFCKRTRRNRTCGRAGRDPSRFAQETHNAGTEPERQILGQVQLKSEVVRPTRPRLKLLSRLPLLFGANRS